jgi:hypothetical protein
MLLMTGHDFFGDTEGFADDAAREAAWFANRAELLAERARDWPGRRPLAYWQFEHGYTDGGAWPGGAAGEGEAVYNLPDVTPDEKAAIEKEWFRGLRISVGQARDLATARESARTSYGVPLWFSAEHAPAIAAELAAEREAAWALPPPGTGYPDPDASDDDD